MSEDTRENPLKSPITKDTKEWTSDLDTKLPIDPLDIPNFKEWIEWNGFQLDRATGQGHNGFDFAAYLTTDNKVMFGLPPDTKIRAVADGVGAQILDNEFTGGGYGALINVEHGTKGEGMFSTYIHVKPTVEYGITVKKGDVIAELYKDEGTSEGRLVHLHLILTSGFGTKGSGYSGGLILRTDDPGLIDQSIYRYKASPQGSSQFSIPDLPGVPIEIANFAKVLVND